MQEGLFGAGVNIKPVLKKKMIKRCKHCRYFTYHIHHRSYCEKEVDSNYVRDGRGSACKKFKPKKNRVA